MLERSIAAEPVGGRCDPSMGGDVGSLKRGHIFRDFFPWNSASELGFGRKVTTFGIFFVFSSLFFYGHIFRDFFLWDPPAGLGFEKNMAMFADFFSRHSHFCECLSLTSHEVVSTRHQRPSLIIDQCGCGDEK